MNRLLAILLVLALSAPAARGESPAWDDAMAAGEAAFAEMDLAAARRHFQAARQAAASFAPDDPRLALTLTGLGTALNGLGAYGEAEPLLNQAIEIWRQSPPESKLQLATALHGLAGIHYSRGEIAAAEPLLERALAIREAALAAEDPALQQTRKSLATLKRAKAQAQPASPKQPPETARAGGYAVHLASLRTVAAANREWQHLKTTFPELLGDLTLALEPADLGERGIFQRLLAGTLAERAQARDLCARLQAKDQYCAVVER
jgi:tetratricopeptide (TPR) repeat protein